MKLRRNEILPKFKKSRTSKAKPNQEAREIGGIDPKRKWLRDVGDDSTVVESRVESCKPSMARLLRSSIDPGLMTSGADKKELIQPAPDMKKHESK
jgi:hypothetical protein